MIGEDGHDALLAADLAEHGSWPMPGGWLDQTAVCIDAVRLIRAESSQWKARLADKDGRG